MVTFKFGRLCADIVSDKCQGDNGPGASDVVQLMDIRHVAFHVEFGKCKIYILKRSALS